MGGWRSVRGSASERQRITRRSPLSYGRTFHAQTERKTRLDILGTALAEQIVADATKRIVTVLTTGQRGRICQTQPRYVRKCCTQYGGS